MMESIKGKAWQLASAILLSVALATTFVSISLSYENGKLQDKANNAVTAAQVLQTDNKALATQLTSSEKQLVQSMNDNELLAKQLKRSADDKALLERTNTGLQYELSAMMQGAKDEHTQSWRDDYVPNDAARLLVSAANCARSPSDKDCVSDNSKGHDYTLQRDTSITLSYRMPEPEPVIMPNESGTVEAADFALRRSWQL